uniref:Aldose 1-epimerase n=1 Tax=Cacopsylla melanoneura TaxID=428564 RepID=A0A8D9ART8_9HEMI
MILRCSPLLLILLCGRSQAGITIFEDTFGHIVNPETQSIDVVRRFTLTNHLLRTQVQIINYGATITSVVTPDCYDKLDDIVLGFDYLEGYRHPENPYMGATIGRVANRISNGTFTVDGVEYRVEKNDRGLNAIHGGERGFDKVLWIPLVTKSDSVTMAYTSVDGESGFPGTVHATVTFTLTLDNRLIIKYNATTDKKTPINLTNHAYFNLAGHRSGSRELVNHVVKLFSESYTEVDSLSLPTGEIRPVNGTPYDLRLPKYMGFALQETQWKGFDHNYVLDGNVSTMAAWVVHPKSGRVLNLYTDQPGVQFYTGGNIRPIYGKQYALYDQFGAFCLETQKYPDALHHDNFPSILLSPGETYEHTAIYEFGLIQLWKK